MPIMFVISLRMTFFKAKKPMPCLLPEVCAIRAITTMP